MTPQIRLAERIATFGRQRVGNVVVAAAVVLVGGSLVVLGPASTATADVILGGTTPPGKGALSFQDYRAIDTRPDGDAAIEVPALKPNETRTVPLDTATFPNLPDNVLAGLINLTVVNPARPGHVVAWQPGTAKPNTSNINLVPGVTASNMLLATLGGNETIRMQNASKGTLNVILDFKGILNSKGSFIPGGIRPVTPQRLVDTRVTGKSVPAHGKLVVPVEGRAGIPKGGAASVLVNLTAVLPGRNGNLSAFASGEAPPRTSNVNFTRGETRTQMALVNVGSDGSIAVANNSRSQINVVVDIAAYILTGDTARQVDTIGKVAPRRIYDSRLERATLQAGGNLVLTHAMLGLPEFDAGAVLTITAANATRAGHLRWGTDKVRSIVNYAAKRDSANLAFFAPSHGLTTVHNGGSGPVDVIVDLVGAIGPHTTVFGTVTAKANQTAVAGIGVRTGSEPSTSTDQAETDESGNYVIHPDLVVCIGGPPSVWVETCLDAGSYVQIPGQVTRANFRLDKAGTLLARLTDPTGADLSTAKIFVEPVIARVPGTPVDGRGGSFSIAGGVATITGLAAGDYFVSVYGTSPSVGPLGLAAEWIHGVPSLPDDKEKYVIHDGVEAARAMGLVTVTVTAEKTTDLGTLQLSAAGALTVHAGTDGATLYRLPGDYGVSSVFPSTGTQTLSGLLPGEYVLCPNTTSVCTPSDTSPHVIVTAGQTSEVSVLPAS
jgi:hypothetical protein